ncbi:MAG: glutamate--tRNA ligase [Hyphomicrobiaceae bacterium]|nr:glutamate--tRNA ligase [Hyphomicrobiaceae bacterium]
MSGDDKKVRVRFAPSPTGRLHVGNIRTALFNFLFARHSGGEFMLRLDDTDVSRSTDAFAQGIKDDLTWLGLDWDIEAKQSERYVEYEKAVRLITEAGRLYPCYETADELDLKRRRQLARGRPPVYDRAALTMSEEELDKYEKEGRRPHWRFKLDHRVITWKDLVRGEQKIDAASFSDPVMIRQGGGYLYTLPSVVDDIDFQISHVIRGEDHVANTAAQIQLFEALGADAPQFGHHNLLVNADGEALSKRKNSLAIAGLREDGLEPLAVNSHAATIGTSYPVAPYQHMEQIAELFDFSKLSRAPARFDENELRQVNARFLHELEYAGASEHLEKLKITGGEPFWLAVRGNLDLFGDVEQWWRVVAGEITPLIDDEALCEAAQNLLPSEPFDAQTWSSWTKAIKDETGAKGKGLFMPLRKALTGQEHGPELKLLLPMMDRARIIARLQGQTA